MSRELAHCAQHGQHAHGCPGCWDAFWKPQGGAPASKPIPTQPQARPATVLSLQDARNKRERAVTLFALHPEELGASAAGLVEFAASPTLYTAVMIRETNTGLALTPIQARALAIALIEFAAQAEMINDAMG